MIVTTLEKVIYRYDPSVNLKAALKDVVKEIKKAAEKEKRRAASAVSSSAKAIFEHIKVDLSTGHLLLRLWIPSSQTYSMGKAKYTTRPKPSLNPHSLHHDLNCITSTDHLLCAC